MFFYILTFLLVYIVLDYFWINLITISFYDTLYPPHHLTEHDYRSYPDDHLHRNIYSKKKSTNHRGFRL